VGESPQPYQHVGIGFLKDSSLIGTFSLPPHDILNPVAFVNMTSSCTMPSYPWIVPDISNSDTFGDRILFNPIELEYEDIYSACPKNYDFNSSINWVDHSQDFGSTSNSFIGTLSTDESIMEIMMLDETAWDDNHRRSSLPETLENVGFNLVQKLPTYESITHKHRYFPLDPKIGTTRLICHYIPFICYNTYIYMLKHPIPWTENHRAQNHVRKPCTKP